MYDSTLLRLQRLSAICVLLLQTQSFARRPSPPPSDNEPIAADEVAPLAKGRMQAYSDGKGHFLLLDRGTKQEHGLLYYSDGRGNGKGDGKNFYRQRIIGFSANGNRVVVTFWEPRTAEGHQAEVSAQDQTATVRCEKREISLHLITPTERATLLEQARFLRPRWNRQAYAFARDERGNHYYVDARLVPADQQRTAVDFSLFIGPKGNLKRQPLMSVLIEGNSEVFVTKTGRLRWTDENEAFWMLGKKTVKLVVLPLEANHGLVYGPQGPYAGQALGTPCDER